MTQIFTEDLSAQGLNYEVGEVLLKALDNVRRYKSDLLIDIARIEEARNKGEEKGEVWFGFRELGVDHKASIDRREREVYSKIYKVTWRPSEKYPEYYREWEVTEM